MTDPAILLAPKATTDPQQQAPLSGADHFKHAQVHTSGFILIMIPIISYFSNLILRSHLIS